MKDLLVVWTLLLIFLLAYGITTEALLYPHEKNKGFQSIVRLVGRAYFELLKAFDFNEMSGIFAF